MSSASDLANAAQALAAALYAVTVDPADALRILGSLAQFNPDPLATTTPLGTARNTMQSRSADLYRRAAVVALARASSIYQPSSSDDAATVRSIVCDALDAEITIAGDQGEDATFNALRSLRSAVSNDLGSRGASLAGVTTTTSNLPIPAIVLAQRLYQDIARADDLITRGNPVHPAFMPLSIKALSK